MPQLLNGTGAAQWGDVEGHPWTTGMQLDYFTEASLWAKWLETEKPNAKVAELTFNNDFGHSYTNGFAYAIKGTDIEVVAQQEHEPTAPNLDNQFTTLAASGADVLLLETSGAFCTQAMAERREADDVEAAGDHVGHVRFAEPVLQAADRPGADRQGHPAHPDVQGRQRPGAAERPVRPAVPEDDARSRASTTRSRPTSRAGSSPGSWSTS